MGACLYEPKHKDASTATEMGLCMCLTCDPEATLAAYGSNWSCQEADKVSVVSHATGSDRLWASRAGRELCLCLFPATDYSVYF